MNYQGDIFESIEARATLDTLLQDSRLFHRSEAYKALLDFVIRLRSFAPFNAMLLHIQKPGLRYAASRADWSKRFHRFVKDDARPLLIMRPFGPVALVYDLMDTEGPDLPESVYAFPAKGPIGPDRITALVKMLAKFGVTTVLFDGGDNMAGSIVRTRKGNPPKSSSAYRMKINRNHPPNTQFATFAHELGHLSLGHLGPDKTLRIPDRLGIAHEQREIEAESVAYLVCCRNGVENKSESYLAHYVEDNTTVDAVDLYQVMRAAGAVEQMLGLNHHAKR